LAVILAPRGSRSLPRSSSKGAIVAKRKPPTPPDEPRYEILAQGDPPRPVDRPDGSDNGPFETELPLRRSPPKTGPKTKAGKERSSQNRTRHGLCQDIRDFRVLRGEDQSIFEDSVSTLVKELQPWDSTTQFLVKNIAECRWHLDRSEFYLEPEIERADGDFINPSLKFERYRASIQRRLTQLEKRFDELRASNKKEEQTAAVEAAKVPAYGPDGKPYEVDRQYLMCKFSNSASPRHYIHNFATEKIILSNGKFWFARTIALAELMEGEFLKPQYGLGDHFQKAFEEWAKTHKVYQPGEPYVTKKWPPPIPENCPPDEWFMDQELSLAEDPEAILKQRAEQVVKEEQAELERQKEEALQAEAERQRRELEEELQGKQNKDDEEDDSEPPRAPQSSLLE
jgi:hypothetical protein